MSIGTEILNLIDNGGRRTGIKRRQFSYTNYVPNRRTEGDRRSGSERRNDTDRRSGLDRRVAFVRALATR